MKPDTTPSTVALSAAAIEFLLHARPVTRTPVVVGRNGTSIVLVRA